MQKISSIQTQAIEAIEGCQDIAALESVKVQYLGKKGALTAMMRSMSELSAEEKPQFGQAVNQAKQAISLQINEKMEQFRLAELQKRLENESIDVTLPGRHAVGGSIHPVTQVQHKINDFFKRLGYSIISGPEIESEYYNFEALNIPEHHPARAMHDTFYFGDGRLLRTHTSPVQIHSLEAHSPPLKLIAPGRVYRCDSDMTHTPMFHQVEGLYIDKNVTMADLREVLKAFFSDFFAQSIEVRFRPSYFPFTEPSAEADIQCVHCQGAGCRTCKFTGWIEILGCGMVHPNVLRAVNISPEVYQGFAFGLGIDRLAMLYFGIDDLRKMFDNDLSFLKQF